MASYDQAIALKPDYASAWNNRGATLRSLGRAEEALASYEHAIAIQPAYAEAHNNRGVTLHELGRFEEAVASYDRALAVKPTTPTRTTIAAPRCTSSGTWRRRSRVMSAPSRSSLTMPRPTMVAASS